MNKVFITWSEFGALIRDLAKKIKKTRMKFSGVYGVPRGGLPIAVYLSHYLNLPLQLYPDKRSLVVDDISDTGKTLGSHKDKFIATLFTTDWTKTKPHCWVVKKDKKSDWLVFPWEDKI